jgi:hypothetical protein
MVLARLKGCLEAFASGIGTQNALSKTVRRFDRTGTGGVQLAYT